MKGHSSLNKEIK